MRVRGTIAVSVRPQTNERGIAEAHNAGRDHAVERHQQVRGLAAQPHRDPERQRGEEADCERPGEAPKDGGRAPHADRHGHDGHGNLGMVVTKIDEAGRVPDVSRHQHRRRDQCHRRRRVAEPRIPGEQRDRCGPARDEHAEELGYRCRHEAGTPLPAAALIRPPR